MMMMMMMMELTRGLSNLNALLRQVRFGTKLGVNLQLTDTLWAGLTDSHAGCPMGVTAENLASDYGITCVSKGRYNSPFSMYAFC